MEYKSIFEQTAEWQTERLGKFTASEIHKLMQKGRNKDDYFGGTAQTYIKGRLAEIITQEPVTNLEGRAAIEWGLSNELDAVMSYERQAGVKVEYFGGANPKFIPFPAFPDWAGGSPDGFVGTDTVIEVKCPYNSTHHITHLLVGSPEDFKKELPEYYGQMQFNMLCSGRNKSVFISYDPRVVSAALRLHVLEIPLDEKYCAELTERIGEAVKMLKAYLECINPSVITAELDKEVNAVMVS